MASKNNTSSDKLYDVLIIGGGAVGLSIARKLAMFNLSIGLLEKASDVSQGASKSNSGIIHGGYDDLHGSLKARVSHKGNRQFDLLNKELHFGFRRTGSLVLAFTEEDMETLAALLENGKKNEVSGLKILDRDEVLKLEPYANPNILGALYCHWSGITSPYEYCIALAESAASNGVDFHFNHEVIDILRVSDDSSVNSHSKLDCHFLIRSNRDGHSFRSRIVINCAGIFADRVAAMVGTNNFIIQPRKGEYIILNKSQGSLAKHVLFPVPNKIKGKGILVSPTYWGNLLLGPTSRGAGDFMNQRQILELIMTSAKKSIPSVDVKEAITSYTGLRSRSSKGDFIIEESAVAGFINVAGIDSPGLTSSPAVADLVVGIVGNSLRALYNIHISSNPDFKPNRRPIITIKSDDFKGRIDDPDPNLNIVCRCERVTEAEIVDSIRRPIGATTTDMVKRRTRAGMGQCQGNFCETRVAKIIARELEISPELVGRHSAGSSVLPHRRVTDDDRQLLEELSKISSKL